MTSQVCSLFISRVKIKLNFFIFHAEGFLYAVIKAINMKKGGPRVSLFELCKQVQWQMPTFKSTEKELRLVHMHLCIYFKDVAFSSVSFVLASRLSFLPQILKPNLVITQLTISLIYFFLDRFVSKITLYIPNLGNIECTGDPRSDKKSSLDSAALVMLYDLEREGKIIIGG